MTNAAHGAELEVEVETFAHRAAPEVKVAATIAFVVAVALVPGGSFWPYAVDAALLLTVAAVTRTPPGLMGQRLVIEVPFILFIVLLPFVGGGETTDVLGLALSTDGLQAAGHIAAKATLAVQATGILMATTQPAAILAGCERLRVPRQLTAIAGFALRYLQVVLAELRRMQAARVARGDDPRWLWQARAVAQSAGALTVRCFERGERVHGAMLARGFEGSMPDVVLSERGTRAAWALALALPVPAVLATLLARVPA
ncbi:MAG TPA: cobalt ECF transporter T component CbiQ [Solirubrobacteraceae bacterium]|nr:cobalt ECF transporter T component CbiQ [Solirubrobacteraceae bacterium]